MLDTIKDKLLVIALVVLIVSGASVITYAVVSWHGQVTGTTQTTQSFAVYKDAGFTQAWSSGDPLGLGQVPSGVQPVIHYYIVNTGNVAVTVSVTGAVAVSCSASWSNAGSYAIGVGASADAQLTITNNASPGNSFSYTFDFTAA